MPSSKLTGIAAEVKRKPKVGGPFQTSIWAEEWGWERSGRKPSSSHVRKRLPITSSVLWTATKASGSVSTSAAFSRPSSNKLMTV